MVGSRSNDPVTLLHGRRYVIRPTGWGWSWGVYTLAGDRQVATGETGTHAEALHEVEMWTARLQVTPELEDAPTRSRYTLNFLLSRLARLLRPRLPGDS